MNMRFAVNRLLVNNFEDCFRFYNEVLGFDYQAGDETGPYVEFKTGETLLALFDRGYMAMVVGAGGKARDVDCQDREAPVGEHLQRVRPALVDRTQDRPTSTK